MQETLTKMLEFLAEQHSVLPANKSRETGNEAKRFAVFPAAQVF